MKKLFTLLTIFTLIGCSPSELDKCIESNSYTNTAYEDYRVGEYIEAWVYVWLDGEKLFYLSDDEYDMLYDEDMYLRKSDTEIELEDSVFDGFFAEERSDLEFYMAQQNIMDAAYYDNTLEAKFKNYSKADWSALEMKYINELKTIAKKHNDKDNISKESAEKICNRQGIY